MIPALLSFFDSDQYYPHAICLGYDPLMLWAYSVTDLAIWASYMAIGAALLVYRSRHLTVTRISFDLLSAFIALCGLTHLTDVVILFIGLYRLDLMLRIATAVVSAATAIYMARRIATEGSYAIS